MNPDWILWIWLIGIVPFGLAVARYVLWAQYDDFVEDMALGVMMCALIGGLWPVAVLGVMLLLIAMPRQRRREVLVSVMTPDRSELEDLDREQLVEKILYLEKRLDKQVKKEIKELKKEYTKGAH